MKIMIDTNVLISALAFPNSTPAKAEVLNSSEYPVVRDESDLPILVCAIDNSIKILVSGDKEVLHKL